MQAAARCDVLVLLGIHRLGGAELSLLSIALGLQKNGFHVHLAVYGSSTDLVKGFLPNVHDLKAPGSLKALLPLVPLVREIGPRVLLSGLRLPNIISVLASRFSQTRTILTEHTPPDAQSTGFRQRFVLQLMNHLYPRASAVVAVSEGIRQGLGKFIKPAKLHLIHNPVIKEASLAKPPAHPWLQSKEPPVVMGIGRLSAEKNFPLLIEAFAIVSAGRSMRLIILGEGEQRAAIEALIKKRNLGDKVLLPGFVDDISSWLPHASLFVSSSNYEGFGNAIVEAMHYRVPVIATDCPVGPTEILDKGSFGRLVPKNNPQMLAEAILAAPDIEIEAAYQRAQLYSEKNCIENYSRLVRELSI